MPARSIAVVLEAIQELSVACGMTALAQLALDAGNGDAVALARIVNSMRSLESDARKEVSDALVAYAASRQSARAKPTPPAQRDSRYVPRTELMPLAFDPPIVALMMSVVSMLIGIAAGEPVCRETADKCYDLLDQFVSHQRHRSRSSNP